jgi:hypothetical protein
MARCISNALVARLILEFLDFQSCGNFFHVCSPWREGLKLTTDIQYGPYYEAAPDMNTADVSDETLAENLRMMRLLEFRLNFLEWRAVQGLGPWSRTLPHPFWASDVQRYRWRPLLYCKKCYAMPKVPAIPCLPWRRCEGPHQVARLRIYCRISTPADESYTGYWALIPFGATTPASIGPTFSPATDAKVSCCLRLHDCSVVLSLEGRIGDRNLIDVPKADLTNRKRARSNSR